MDIRQVTHGIGGLVRGVRDLALAGAGAVVRRIAGSTPEHDHQAVVVRPEPGARAAAEARSPAAAARRSRPAEPPGFAHGPKASSRRSAHGERGAGRDDLVDDWEAEADESVPDATQPRPEPVDDGTLKAIRKEAETMRRAADPRPE